MAARDADSMAIATAGATTLLPLLERDAELAAVRAAWDAATPGQGHAWFVCAEGGGGKTAFLSALAAAWPRANLYWGEAEPLSPPEPYLAISRAIPEFKAGRNQTDSVGRALEALRSRAAGRRIAVVLDDLQFADQGTLAVARRLAVEARAQGWLVLMAFRPRDGLSELEDMAAELAGNGRATRLDLRELSRAGVGALARRLRGEALDAATEEQLHADSGGNPWFVEALARGDATLSAATQHLQLRLSRIERALPGAPRVLHAFSVVTRPIPYAVVAQICGGDDSQLRSVLQGLRDAHILIEADDQWKLRQEMLRRAIDASMIPADRRDAHRKLAEALEPEGRAAELAMHYATAGDARASRWALRAAEQATALEAHAEAYAQLERALAGTLSLDDQLRAHELAVTESGALFRFDEPVQHALAGLKLAGDDAAAITRLATSLALTHHWRGEVERAETYWQRARDAAATIAPNSDVGQMHAWRALCEIASEHPDRALQYAATALTVLDALNEDDRSHRLARALAELSTALASLTRGEQAAIAAANTALERIREIGLVPWTMAVAAFCATAIAALELDAADVAASTLAAALERRQVGLRLTNRAIADFIALQRGNLGAITLPAPRGALPIPPRSAVHGRLRALHALRELRAGVPGAADEWLGDTVAMQPRPLAATNLDIARLEYLSLRDAQAAAAYARTLLPSAERRQQARLCGEAAVALARVGQATALPDWLPENARLRVFWDWARGIEHNDADALRAVVERLQDMGCLYESACALVDAGELREALRRLRVLGATTLTDLVTARMRSAGEVLPRRTRAAVAADGLTDTERKVCAFIADGLRNKELAERLHMSVRTVETHLTNIYRKTGVDNRNALARWWMERERGAKG